MSIDFSQEETQQPLLSTAHLGEDEGELSLRPRKLTEYIGQEKAKENLSIFIDAAKLRGEPLDHVLLHGPPGLGKTTLSGIIAKVGAIAAIRVIYFTVGAEALRGTWVQTVCIVLTLVTIFMGSFMGCTENGLKKRLAYSSISQISYVLLGVFLMTPVGLLGGLLQLLFHALAKIGVFQSAGSIIFLTETETIDGFPGLGRRIPVTMGCFAALALSLVGIPPFGGFFSKWYLALGALDGMSAPLCYIIPAVLLISALLTAAYLFPPLCRAFFPGQDFPARSRVREPLLLVLSLALFAAASLILGLLSGITVPVMEHITGSIL